MTLEQALQLSDQQQQQQSKHKTLEKRERQYQLQIQEQTSTNFNELQGKNISSANTSSSDQATTVPGSLRSTINDPLTSIFNNNNSSNNFNNQKDIVSSITSDHFYNTVSQQLDIHQVSDDNSNKQGALVFDNDQLQRIMDEDDEDDDEQISIPLKNRLKLKNSQLKQSASTKSATKIQQNFISPIDQIQQRELNIRQLLSAHYADQTNTIVNDKSFLNHRRLKQFFLPTISKHLHNQQLISRGGVPKCVCFYDKFILIGNSQGVIRIFDEQQREYSSIGSAQNQPKQFRNNAVQSLDVSKNGMYLVSGYKRGQIVLWNMNSYKKLDISQAHKGVQIVFVKFYKCSDRICVISGDMDGFVYLIEFYKVMMTFSHDFQCLLKLKSTVWAIQPLFQDGNDFYIQECSELIGNISLCAIASQDELKIVVLYPKAKVLISVKASQITGIYTHSRNIYGDDDRINDVSSSLPYLDWGRGVTPQNRQNTLPVLAYAWDKILQLGVLRCIQGVFFLSESVIAIITNKQVKVIYSGFMHPGKYTKQGVQSDPYLSNIGAQNRISQTKLNLNKVTQSSVLQSTGDNASYQPIGQMYMNYLSNNDSGKASYHQAVSRYNNKLIILSKDVCSAYKLQRWQSQLEQLFDSKKVKQGLSFILRLYIGDCKGFAGIPHSDSFQRQKALKQKMNEFLRDVMMVFTPIIIIKSKIKRKKFFQNFNSSDDDTEAQKMKQQQEMQELQIQQIMKNVGNIDPIKASIQFCVATRSWDYLFDELQPRYCELGLGQEFIRDLEPFILEKRLTQVKLSSRIVGSLLDYYGKLEPEAGQIFEKIIYFISVANGVIASKLLEFLVQKRYYSAMYFLLFSQHQVVYESGSSRGSIEQDYLSIIAAQSDHLSNGSPEKQSTDEIEIELDTNLEPIMENSYSSITKDKKASVIKKIIKQNKKNNIKVKTPFPNTQIKHLQFKNIVQLMFRDYLDIKNHKNTLIQNSQGIYQNIAHQDQSHVDNLDQEQLGNKILWLLKLFLSGKRLIDKQSVQDKEKLFQNTLSFYQWVLQTNEGQKFIHQMMTLNEFEFFQLFSNSYRNNEMVQYLRRHD